MAGYRLSPQAQADLREIKEYTREHWGNLQARQYLIELALKFEQLAAAPGLGQARDEIAGGIRGFQASHHVIFYREKEAAIEIARVLHPSMDMERRFED